MTFREALNQLKEKYGNSATLTYTEWGNGSCMIYAQVMGGGCSSSPNYEGALAGLDRVMTGEGDDQAPEGEILAPEEGGA